MQADLTTGETVAACVICAYYAIGAADWFYNSFTFFL